MPIWVVALWPRKTESMRRALRCDGVVSQFEGEEHAGNARWGAGEMRRWLSDNGARADIDVIAQGETPGNDPDELRRSPVRGRRLVAPGGWRRTGRCPITPPNGWSRSWTRLVAWTCGVPLNPWCRGWAVSSVDGSAQDLGAEGTCRTARSPISTRRGDDGFLIHDEWHVRNALAPFLNVSRSKATKRGNVHASAS